MWWLLRYVFLGPPAQTAEVPLRRRLNAVEADVEQLQNDRDATRGKFLTLQRRIRELERDVDRDWDEDEDEEPAIDWNQVRIDRMQKEQGNG